MERRDRRARWRRLWAFLNGPLPVALIVLAVSGVAWLIVYVSSGEEGRKPAEAERPPPPHPPPPPRGVTVPLDCPAPPIPRGRPSLVVRVVAWCAIPEAAPDKPEFKFKLRVTNTSKEQLDIRRPRWRLLVESLDREAWRPPAVGQQTPEEPYTIPWPGGPPVWAVPANPEDAYDPDPDNPLSGTFATHWSGTTLRPGETYEGAKLLSVAAYYRSKNPPPSDGVLTYYVPQRARRGRPRLPSVVGLAYLDEDKVVKLIVDREEWGDQRPADSF